MCPINDGVKSNKVKNYGPQIYTSISRSMFNVTAPTIAVHPKHAVAVCARAIEFCVLCSSFTHFPPFFAQSRLFRLTAIALFMQSMRRLAKCEYARMVNTEYVWMLQSRESCFWLTFDRHCLVVLKHKACKVTQASAPYGACAKPTCFTSNMACIHMFNQ